MVEPSGCATQVPHPVAVGVLEGAQVRLVDDDARTIEHGCASCLGWAWRGWPGGGLALGSDLATVEAMASQTQAREAERKLSVRTLAVASISSVVAAIVVSQFWKGGTAPAAAVTPVIVSLVSELLHKPSQAITARVTSERTAVLPGGTGARAPAEKTEVAAGAPAPDLKGSKPASQERQPPLRESGEEPVSSDTSEAREPAVTYHRAGANGRPGGGGRKFPVRIVAATAALAILIGAAILTVPELIAGDSVGKSSGGTTLFGGGKNSADETQDSQRQDGSQREDGSAQPDQEQPKSDQQDRGTQQELKKTPPADQTKPETKPPTTPAPQSPQKSPP